MRKWMISIPALVLVVFVSGCVVDTTAVLRMDPAISQFLAEHPNAVITATHFSLAEFDGIRDDILEFCSNPDAFVGKTEIAPAEYYVVTIVDEDSGLYITAAVDWTDQVVECAVMGDATDEGVIDPTDWIPVETTTTEPATGQEAEQEFQDAVCSEMPTSAIHTGQSTMGVVALQVPSSLDSILGGLGYAMTLVRDEYVTDLGASVTAGYSGEKYITNCWKDVGDVHHCIIPVAIDLGDGNGEQDGAIKLAFEGALVPRQTDSTSPCAGGGDCPVPKCYPYCDSQPVSTYTRTSCEVDIQQPCPEQEGSVLCGQCEYKDFWSDGTDIANLGQCRYCPEGTACSYSVSICGSFSCVSGTRTTEPANLQKYFTICSGCQSGQRTYYYNGYDYETCNYYYNLCLDNDCTDKLTNCG